MGPLPNGDWASGPPPHGGYMNGDRYPRDRGPPGAVPPGPPRGYDGRGPGGPYDQRGPPPRRQPWEGDGHRPTNLPYAGPPGSRLPPPPPEGSRHPLPHPPTNRAYGTGASRPPRAPNVDTYIPSYADGGRRGSNDRERDDRSSRDRSRPPSRDERRGYRERRPRDDDTLEYEEGGRRRTRSRSPASDVYERRDRDRDRRERDRDIYRR
ncbi:hypothetical protein MPH_06913 [Macrophomina phaseolina MS6]|uniref:Uncharacterized protein n=2 Tax=Macrophomina phaseolina TaxID=35725 RepID=K2RTB7_MACPH|nr:hypothetical protein MPH_06913 [Macrophomina phaseolina MS6]